MIHLYGFSRSCLSTSFYWPETEILLDCGPFAPLYGVEAKYIFISHLHPDHTGGLINLLYMKFCRKKLHKLHIYAPEKTCCYLKELISITDKTDIHALPEVNIIPLEERVKILNNIYCQPLETFHRCESTGFSFIKGKEVIFSYTSDTNSRVLENPCLIESRTLMIESTYLEEEDIEKAFSRGHIALPELNKFTKKFRGEKIYLNHFLESYKSQDIYKALRDIKFNFLLEPAGLELEK